MNKYILISTNAWPAREAAGRTTKRERARKKCAICTKQIHLLTIELVYYVTTTTKTTETTKTELCRLLDGQLAHDKNNKVDSHFDDNHHDKYFILELLELREGEAKLKLVRLVSRLTD